MRTKADNFEVGDPDKAMENFQMLLGDLIKVPKDKIGTKKIHKNSHADGKRNPNMIYGKEKHPNILRFLGQSTILLPDLGNGAAEAANY